ncbi:lethal(3)malignant brain tumor-like protein 3 [Cygnus atratus]|uniref:lethal(3)malignant brain tumor-like protein 3 n=1 Tax=Cygnus atratus TaxID=8868 RepID=UPI0015D5BD93|nr:lethal(3)malignant brain tumor-like protein 3 [Cygnus atratus]XP_035394786.1 lethal(3)malignant brain tumor-like protein 3 [Cygnus atratus]XP_035394787.1 lethal(3)malignant brain tumor-like protein 3 [Cygnus atratus]XP_035394788.1 lethal(3)malignant brain tumor-like protein 3 [Cygnus atratus]XP_050565879.1 lethal(3)malignant brain tumor-like protein 3 [Cygnus atratus]XP_050565880.1 lethal(3)malignant brain tumor-like protein 3 [Cygnus atratus]
MNESAASGNGQEFDVFSAMDWKDGIGTLPGSDLKFRVNEFGALEVITDETEMENVKKATATTTWMVPTAQEAFSEKTGIPTKLKETAKMDGLVFCENCYRYGTIEEFVPEGKFCSQKCAQQVKNREPKEEKPNVECNGEDDSKGIRKRKAKLPLKEESRDNGEKKENPNETEDKPEGRILRVSQRARRKRKGEITVLKQTVHSKGKQAWCWASYLEEEKAVAVPTKLFKEYQSFPYNKNGFKVGMKLEGVDPEHQSIYCVLTVAEVCGYRIRLHFDGYPDCYDFWVNADSSDIHPVGWCEKTGHKLHPPKGYKEEEFSWPSYLKACKAQAAPKSLFENQNTTVIPSGFRVGMKLEAVDKKNPTFICVATVTDMVDNRFLVHFDNWDESYDYWCEAASPHIHPVGWCKEHKRTLITPPDYPHAKHFSWEKYLEETSSLPAPARAFKVKPSHGFQKNMKLEVVDKRNPVFIRVATIVDTDDYRIKVHFDGWDSIYDYWTDVDSPDIHPAGWCTKTGHPLQPPLSPLELVEALEHGGCPTAGCKGVGHIKRARHIGHHSAVSCPYSEMNLNKESLLPDRLSGEMPAANPAPRNRRVEARERSPSPVINSDRKCPSPGHIGAKSSVHNRSSGKTVSETTKQEDGESTFPCKKLPLLCDVKEKKPPSGVLQTKDSIKNKECEEEERENKLLISNEIKDTEEPNTQRLLSQPVVVSSKVQIPGLPLRWEQHSKLLPSVAGIPASKVSKWSTDEVSEFIRSLPGCEEHGKVFKDEQIDGEAFLLMTQSDIVKIMSIKLGPALKIFNSILMFKAAEKNSHNEL